MAELRGSLQSDKSKTIPGTPPNLLGAKGYFNSKLYHAK